MKTTAKFRAPRRFRLRYREHYVTRNAPEKTLGTFEDSWIRLASYTADQANAGLNENKKKEQNK